MAFPFARHAYATPTLVSERLIVQHRDQHVHDLERHSFEMCRCQIELKQRHSFGNLDVERHGGDRIGEVRPADRIKDHIETGTALVLCHELIHFHRHEVDRRDAKALDYQWMFVTGVRRNNLCPEMFGHLHRDVTNTASATLPVRVRPSSAEDVATANHRRHHWGITKGGDLDKMAADKFGKATGLSDDRGGHM